MTQKSKKTIIIAIALLAALSLVTLAALCHHIIRYGLYEDGQNADVIIVLGAAVWPDGPSPALTARVRRGSKLYHEGRAPFIIFSGGLGEHAPTEAEAMAVLAFSWQVAPQHVYLEDRSTNTRENIAFASEIMQKKGWQRALIVTDYFHMKRAVLLARDHGLEPLRAPVAVETSYYTPRERVKYTLRECAALLQYYLLKPFTAAKAVFLSDASGKLRVADQYDEDGSP